MPSDRQTRKQRHQAQVKTQTGKAIRGAQATEFVKGSGYRKTEFIGGKKFFTAMSSDPNASGAGGDVTNITVTGSTGAGGDVKSDGTVHFTAPQTGVEPTSDLHLATKKYVDDNATDFTLTGDVTGGSGAGTIATTIANNAVENSMMADNSVNTSELVNNSVTIGKLQQIGTDSFLGRDSAGTGNVEVISLDDLEVMLNLNQYLSVASLNTLTDVTVNNSTVAAGHYLSYNGTNFINTTFNSADITGLQASQIPALTTSKIISGTFANARISESSVTQHTAAIKSTGSFMTGFDLHPDIAVTDQQIIKIVTQQGSYGTGTVSTSGNVHTITLNAQDTNTDTNRLTTFTLTADSGTNQTLIHGNTLDIEGGSAISTSVSSSGTTDKVTINATGNLPTLAGLSATTGNFIVASGGAFTVQSGATARATLGLGSAATQNTSAFLAADATGANEWTVSGTVSGGKVLANTSNTNYDLNVGSNGAGIYGTTYIFNSGLYGYHSSTNSYFQFQNDSNVGYIRMSASGGAGSSYKGLTIDAGGTALNSGRVKIDTQLGVNITSTANWSTTSAAKLVVGKILSNSSSAAAQIHGGIRCTSWVVMHQSTNLSNSVYWQYGNGGLQTGSEGSGTQNVYAGGDVVAYYSSDPRLKTNKKRIEKPLTLLSKINGYTFDWKKYASKFGSHLVGKDYGVMADEIEEVMPELVHDRDNGYKGVKYEKIVPLLIECIKEQQIQIDQLKKWKENKKWI